MAYLLGNKFCVDSLQKDVGDLQAVIVDIFSRTGAISVPSWKYPDKISCDLDINDLLDRYQFSENEEDTQVSHIILLELVIDRFVLIIQAFAKYTEQMLLMGRASSASTTPSNSVGLIVKKFWNKMIHLHSIMKQLQTDNRVKSKKMTELEEMVQSMSNLNTPSNIEEAEETPFWATPALPRKTTVEPSISSDTNCKASQTYETAFIPCEACDGTQFCLKDAGKSISETCKALSLSSCLTKSVAKYQDSWMSLQDLRSWLSEQNKDLQSINTQVVTLSHKVFDLEKELENSKAQCHKLQSDLKKSKQEIVLQKENITVTRKQYEKKIQDAKEKHNDAIKELERKNALLQEGKEALEVNVADLKGQLDSQRKAFRNLEENQRKLSEDLEVNKTSQQEVKKSQKYVEIVEKELKALHDKLETCSRTIAREEAKNRSSSKQIETLKNKHTQLSETIENLEQENEDLKTELATLESEKESLAECLDSTSSELKSAETKYTEVKERCEMLNQEKDELKKRVVNLEEEMLGLEMKLQKAKDQERLLMEYPDLNGPINTDYEGTGNVARDMENQIRANTVRIGILTDENNHLRQTVLKIVETENRQNATRTPSTGTPERVVNDTGRGGGHRPTKNTNIVDPSNVPKLQLWRT